MGAEQFTRHQCDICGRTQETRDAYGLPLGWHEIRDCKPSSRHVCPRHNIRIMNKETDNAKES